MDRRGTIHQARLGKSRGRLNTFVQMSLLPGEMRFFPSRSDSFSSNQGPLYHTAIKVHTLVSLIPADNETTTYSMTKETQCQHRSLDYKLAEIKLFATCDSARGSLIREFDWRLSFKMQLLRDLFQSISKAVRQAKHHSFAYLNEKNSLCNVLEGLYKRRIQRSEP